MKLYTTSKTNNNSNKIQVASKLRRKNAEKFANKIIRERKQLMDRLADA